MDKFFFGSRGRPLSPDTITDQLKATLRDELRAELMAEMTAEMEPVFFSLLMPKLTEALIPELVPRISELLPPKVAQSEKWEDEISTPVLEQTTSSALDASHMSYAQLLQMAEEIDKRLSELKSGLEATSRATTTAPLKSPAEAADALPTKATAIPAAPVIASPVPPVADAATVEVAPAAVAASTTFDDDLPLIATVASAVPVTPEPAPPELQPPPKPEPVTVNVAVAGNSAVLRLVIAPFKASEAALHDRSSAPAVASAPRGSAAVRLSATALLRHKRASATQPITYRKALQDIGGATKLAQYAQTSRSIEARTHDLALKAELKLLLPRDYKDRIGYSTLLVHQRFVRTLPELYAQARVAHHAFEELIYRIAHATGGTAIVPPIKGEARARMKALFKYCDAEGGGIAWYRLTDIVRATISYPDIGTMYAGVDAVIACLPKEDILEFNDRYQKPLAGGYMDLQMVVRISGHVCELQLSTEPMLRAKETTGHRDFEVVRELKAAIKEGDLGRVESALEFGLEHLGSAKGGESAAALTELLRSDDACTLIHEAAARGSAEIVHALLCNGASANAVNKEGDTPLHIAVYRGYERCVWALVCDGDPDFDIKNDEGQTALVMGYMALWRRPPEPARRAVVTLVEKAGAERVADARVVADVEVRKRFKPNLLLVDHATDGNVEKMREELQAYADPDSKRAGQSALAAALANPSTNQKEAVDLLLDFKASLSTVDLKDKPEAARLLLSCGVEASELRKAGCSARDLMTAGAKVWLAGYSAEELDAVGVGVAEVQLVKEAGYTVEELEAEGVGEAELLLVEQITRAVAIAKDTPPGGPPTRETPWMGEVRLVARMITDKRFNEEGVQAQRVTYSARDLEASRAARDWSERLRTDFPSSYQKTTGGPSSTEGKGDDHFHDVSFSLNNVDLEIGDVDVTIAPPYAAWLKEPSGRDKNAEPFPLVARVITDKRYTGECDYAEFCQFIRDREEREFTDDELKKRFNATHPDSDDDDDDDDVGIFYDHSTSLQGIELELGVIDSTEGVVLRAGVHRTGGFNAFDAPRTWASLVLRDGPEWGDDWGDELGVGCTPTITINPSFNFDSSLRYGMGGSFGINKSARSFWVVDPGLFKRDVATAEQLKVAELRSAKWGSQLAPEAVRARRMSELGKHFKARTVWKHSLTAVWEEFDSAWAESTGKRSERQETEWAKHAEPTVPESFFTEYVRVDDRTPRSDAAADGVYWDALSAIGAPYVTWPVGDGKFGNKWPAPVWGVCLAYEKRHGPPPTAHVAKIPSSDWLAAPAAADKSAPDLSLDDARLGLWQPPTEDAVKKKKELMESYRVALREQVLAAQTAQAEYLLSLHEPDDDDVLPLGASDGDTCDLGSGWALWRGRRKRAGSVSYRGGVVQRMEHSAWYSGDATPPAASAHDVEGPSAKK